MVLRGQYTINYELNGKSKRICVKVKMNPIKGLMKPRQPLWYAEATINGRKINHRDLEGCVNAQFVAEDIAENKIKELRKKNGRSLKITSRS